MQTLVTVLVATVLTMVIGIAGDLAANNDRRRQPCGPSLTPPRRCRPSSTCCPRWRSSALRVSAIVAAHLRRAARHPFGRERHPQRACDRGRGGHRGGSDRRQLMKVQLPVAPDRSAGLEPGHRAGALDGRGRRPGGRRGAGLRRRGRLLATSRLRPGPGRRGRDRVARHHAGSHHARCRAATARSGSRCGMIAPRPMVIGRSWRRYTCTRT